MFLDFNFNNGIFKTTVLASIENCFFSIISSIINDHILKCIQLICYVLHTKHSL